MPVPLILGLAVVGLVTGLGLLVRGLRAQRAAARIDDVGTSRIGTLAAGEVRVTGTAVAAGVTLSSRLRLRPTVYYRAEVRDGADGERSVLDEQHAIGFFVRDASGEIRVFPRSARWDVPLDGETSFAEGGVLTGAGALMLPPETSEDPLHPGRTDAADFAMRTLIGSGISQGGLEPRYREARIEPGDIVTVVGWALPFRDLADPTEADVDGDLDTLTGAVDGYHVPDLHALEDPEVADSYARAREEGTLVDSPTEAWGNAAIEGFGIGQPVRPPELDPDVVPPATPPGTMPSLAGQSPKGPVGSHSTAADTTNRSFEIPPDRLVIAAGPDRPLLIAAGSPGEASQRSEGVFRAGILGGALAIGSAILLALAISGTFGR